MGRSNQMLDSLASPRPENRDSVRLRKAGLRRAALCRGRQRAEDEALGGIPSEIAKQFRGL
jgi:hypothetical protein